MADTSRTLKGLTLRNYRAFENVSISLAPITILVGPNNAGKSSILSAIRLLSQTLSSVDPKTSLLLEELGSYKDVVYKHDPKRAVGFAIEFELDGKNMSIDLTYGYRAQRREVVLQQFSATEVRPDGSTEPLLRTSFAVTTGHQLIRLFRGIPDVSSAKVPMTFVHFLPRFGSLVMDRVFKKVNKKLRQSGHLSRQAMQAQMVNVYRQFPEVNRMFIRLHQFLISLQYLGPFRESPRRLYPFSGERPSVLSQSGSGTTDVLMSDYFRRGDKKGQLTRQVKAWLERAQIAADLQVEALSDRHYEVTLKHPVSGEVSNIADVGFGASQVLPVLVAGYEVAENSLLMIEQPEIHLHPRAQAELGEFFTDVYRRNVQTIIETHSEHLIMRLQRKVALGEIKKEDVVIHYVEPTSEGKRVVTLQMDDNGIFTEKWPNGFFEERLSEAINLAKAPLIRVRAEA